MVRSIPITDIVNSNIFSSYPTPLAIGLFASISLLVAICAKHARKRMELEEPAEPNTLRAMFRSTPKQLMTTLSHKAMSPLRTFIGNNKNKLKGSENVEDEYGGVWQKAIMMGEKCQPLEFSGVIFYDYDGNRVSEMPKSPMASPLRDFGPLRDFTIPVSSLSKV